MPIAAPYPPLQQRPMLGVGAPLPPPPPRRASPALAIVSPVGAMAGLGQDTGTVKPTPLAIAVAVGFLGLTGWLSYQAGKAMAPRAAKPNTWGWIGVPVGLFTGPVGLGVMGVVSNRQDKV